MESHAEFLRLATLDEPLAAAIREDWRSAPLDERDRRMLEYADKLTRDATKVQREDIEGLREVGFDDQAIVQINLIASWFNYINRVADGLGVARL